MAGEELTLTGMTKDEAKKRASYVLERTVPSVYLQEGDVETQGVGDGEKLVVSQKFRERLKEKGLTVDAINRMQKLINKELEQVPQSEFRTDAGAAPHIDRINGMLGQMYGNARDSVTRAVATGKADGEEQKHMMALMQEGPKLLGLIGQATDGIGGLIGAGMSLFGMSETLAGVMPWFKRMKFKAIAFITNLTGDKKITAEDLQRQDGIQNAAKVSKVALATSLNGPGYADSEYQSAGRDFAPIIKTAMTLPKEELEKVADYEVPEVPKFTGKITRPYTAPKPTELPKVPTLDPVIISDVTTIPGSGTPPTPTKTMAKLQVGTQTYMVMLEPDIGDQLKVVQVSFKDGDNEKVFKPEGIEVFSFKKSDIKDGLVAGELATALSNLAKMSKDKGVDKPTTLGHNGHGLPDYLRDPARALPSLT